MHLHSAAPADSECVVYEQLTSCLTVAQSDPRLAKTATRIDYLLAEILPDMRDQTGLDSGPTARPAAERTKNSSHLDELFGLMDSMLACVDPDFIWVQMDVNWQNMMARMSPTHVLVGMPEMSEALLQCEGGHLDKYWV